MHTHLGTIRPRAARRRAPAGLAALLLAASAAGCGGSDRADDGDPAPVESSPSSPGEAGDAGGGLAAAAEDAALVSASNAGGSVDPRATPLQDRRAVAAFARPLDSALAEDVEQAWAQADPGGREAVVAAVVDVSCEAPEAVEVREGPAALLVEAVAPPAAPERQCLVPVTTVAVLTVPAGAV